MYEFTQWLINFIQYIIHVLNQVSFQLNVHPIDDENLQYIESLAFRCFKQRDNDSSSPSAANSQIIAALYAEVIGVLAMARFPNIRKRFTAEFKEHQTNPSTLINLIYGMKYLTIKVNKNNIFARKLNVIKFPI